MRKRHKSKHNKKRNTAFLYEVLIQDIARSVVNGDASRKEAALNICKEFFGRGSILHAEKELYRTMVEASDVDSSLLEKLLAEAKREYSQLDPRQIFNTQTKLVNQINKRLSPSVFSNFVSNYKDLATISQILNQSAALKKRVLLEHAFIESVSRRTDTPREEMEPTDNLVYKTFVKSYNEKYEEGLLEEQKEVITRFATAFSDNGLSLKSYLNEEFTRLKNVVEASRQTPIIKEDKGMLHKTEEVLGILESYRQNPSFDNEIILQILEIQNLAKEMES